MISKVRTFLAYRELLWVLTLREIQIRYKQSVLGIIWAVLQPLGMALAFTLIFSLLLKVDTGETPYILFSYSGVILWTLFSNSLTRAIPSLEANSSLIRKIYLPREFFPMSSVLGAFFDFLISVVIFVGLMIYYRNFVHLTPNVLYVIPILLIQMIFTFGLCFFASAVDVYYRDVKHALPFLIQVWMFVTPIMYPVDRIPDRFQLYYFLNPMSGIVVNFRRVAIDGLSPSFNYLGIAAAGAILLFIVGYWYFKRVEMEFADVV
jgi:lipopolysaccharide transport system permease protein